MQKIKMLLDFRASEDGYTVLPLKKDKEYELKDFLAEKLIKNKIAVALTKEKQHEKEPAEKQAKSKKE